MIERVEHAAIVGMTVGFLLGLLLLHLDTRRAPESLLNGPTQRIHGHIDVPGMLDFIGPNTGIACVFHRRLDDVPV